MDGTKLTGSLIRRAAGALAIAGFFAAGPAFGAGDPPECKTVRFSDVGWSCITATTGIASKVLDGLGYEPKATVLSVPVTFESLSIGDIDAFLGLWLPTQESMIRPYFDAGTIDEVQTNLTGAKYTMAVPQYVYEGGVENFGDLNNFADKFGRKLYGIEPGNDGNMLILSMIDNDAFGLGDWEIVESSEHGMLAQVERSVRTGEWIVFLGWEPHPMNFNYEMAYLGGGDDWFGPDYGGATVYTLAHHGYTEKCSNVGRLLENMTFTLEMENEMMGWMLDEGMEPDAAAARLLEAHPEVLDRWLDGVTTLDGTQDGVTAVRASLGLE